MSTKSRSVLPAAYSNDGTTRTNTLNGASLWTMPPRPWAPSKRTLARRMQDVLGKTPLSYFQSLRVERAVHLLKTGSASVEEVAERVGYREGATLRTLLRRQLNLGVKEIRRTG